MYFNKILFITYTVHEGQIPVRLKNIYLTGAITKPPHKCTYSCGFEINQTKRQNLSQHCSTAG